MEQINMHSKSVRRQDDGEQADASAYDSATETNVIHESLRYQHLCPEKESSEAFQRSDSARDISSQRPGQKDSRLLRSDEGRPREQYRHVFRRQEASALPRPQSTPDCENNIEKLRRYRIQKAEVAEKHPYHAIHKHRWDEKKRVALRMHQQMRQGRLSRWDSHAKILQKNQAGPEEWRLLTLLHDPRLRRHGKFELRNGLKGVSSRYTKDREGSMEILKRVDDMICSDRRLGAPAPQEAQSNEGEDIPTRRWGPRILRRVNRAFSSLRRWADRNQDMVPEY